MNTIKFSNHYPKLYNQTSAKLLAVEPLTIDENTPEELIDYDTKTTEGGKFSLAYGEYLQLVFLGDLRIPFCTIRRMNYDNLTFYKNNIGMTFKVVVLESV